MGTPGLAVIRDMGLPGRDSWTLGGGLWGLGLGFGVHV